MPKPPIRLAASRPRSRSQEVLTQGIYTVPLIQPVEAPQEINSRLPGLLDIFRPVHLIFIMVHFRDLPTQFTPGRSGDLSKMFS
jgi:hypothetical protein